MSDVPARRRWLHFSLWTLLILSAICAGWLVWNVRQVDQRDFIVEAIESRGGSIRRVEFFRGPGVSPRPLPRLWSWIGADPIESITLPDTLYTAADRDYAQSMFPEANVTLYHIDDARMRRKGYVISRRQEDMPGPTLHDAADDMWRNPKAAQRP